MSSEFTGRHVAQTERISLTLSQGPGGDLPIGRMKSDGAWQPHLRKEGVNATRVWQPPLLFLTTFVIRDRQPSGTAHGSTGPTRIHDVVQSGRAKMFAAQSRYFSIFAQSVSQWKHSRAIRSESARYIMSIAQRFQARCQAGCHLNSRADIQDITNVLIPYRFHKWILYYIFLNG